MPDESAATTKSAAEDLKEKSPQVVIATTIALLSELLTNDTQAKVLKITAPAIALVIVLSISKLTELGVFLFNYFTTKKPEQPESETPLDVLLKRFIREGEKELRWMRKSNPDYPGLVKHIKLLKQRLRAYQLGKLDISISAESVGPTPPPPAAA